MGELFDKVEKFVKESFIKLGQEIQLKHFERTVYWIKELNPKADEALIISAIAHDIERAFRSKDMLQRRAEAKFTDIKFIRPHEEKGAEIIADFLKKERADLKVIEKVKMLISRHEEGGNDEQNMLKDADSISFFENNIPSFLKKVQEDGKENTRQKFDFMYNRITLKKAKDLAKPFYDKAVKELEKI